MKSEIEVRVIFSRRKTISLALQRDGSFELCAPIGTSKKVIEAFLEDKKEWLASRQNVALGSDAFFPFSDNIKRAAASGVKYIAEPGGSIRDDLVIEECNNRGIVMAFTGMRLFHH